ncbi:MAG: hypothetical protein AAB597_02540 [Patescibacteria group bacterium]
MDTDNASKKYRICVSGAAETGHCGLDAFDKAREMGKEIVRQNGVIITGATTGFPTWAAMGSKEEKGISIGFSPATSERDHLLSYRLPTEYMDIIVYTGFGYSGRNLILTRSSEAVLIGCGRIGTINEFTIAYEDQKPIGILRGSWETDEVIQEIISKGHRLNERIVFDDNPKTLVEKIVKLVEKDRKDNDFAYRNYDGVQHPGFKPVF